MLLSSLRFLLLKFGISKSSSSSSNLSLEKVKIPAFVMAFKARGESFNSRIFFSGVLGLGFVLSFREYP